MPAKIYYAELPEEWRKERKLEWFAQNHDFDQIDFTRIHPDKNHNWINLQTDDLQNEWEEFIRVANKEANETIFNLFSNGISTYLKTLTEYLWISFL